MRDGEYGASPWEWVSTQVATYERTGGKEGNTLMETGMPIIILTTKGNRTGLVRKTPLMRVEHRRCIRDRCVNRRGAEAPGLVLEHQG